MRNSICSLKLCELAERFNLRLQGDGNTLIESVGTLADASGNQISFLANPVYREQLKTTRAGAVIVSAKDAKRLIKKVKTSSGPAAITDIGVIEAEGPGRAYLRGTGGGRRILEMLAGEQLPRIC